MWINLTGCAFLAVLNSGSDSNMHTVSAGSEKIFSTHGFVAVLKDGRMATLGSKDFFYDLGYLRTAILDAGWIYSVDSAFAAVLKDLIVLTWSIEHFCGDLIGT